MNALCLSAFGLQITRLRCAAGQNNGIKIFQNLISRNLFADIGIGSKKNAFFGHEFHTSVNDRFIQFHIRNAVHQKTADSVRAFKDRDKMTSFVELVSGGKPGGA